MTPLEAAYLCHCRVPGYRLRQRLLGATAQIAGRPLWPRVLPHTLLSWPRLHSLERLGRRVLSAGVPGVFMECGVAHGGSAALLGRVLSTTAPDRALWLCDTFEGLPPGGERDADREVHAQWVGDRLKSTADQILARLNSYGVTVPVHCVEGLYQDTLPAADLPAIALLHLDADWYNSTMTCLRHLWPRISPGGVVQLDDYGSFQGCREAVSDFFGDTPPTLHRIDFDGVWLEHP